MNVMPDLFRHPNLSAQIPRSRNAVRDDKVFLRWLLINSANTFQKFNFRVGCPSIIITNKIKQPNYRG